MKKTFFLSLLVAIFALSTFAQKETGSITVKGEVLNSLYYSKITLENILAEETVGTSNIEDDGSFSISAEIEGADYFKLGVNSQNYMLLILEPGENVTITFDPSDPVSSKIVGSPGSILYQKTNKEALEIEERIIKEKNDYYKKVIENNPNSIACVIYADELDMAEYMDTHKKLADGLKDSENSYAQSYVQKVNAQSITGIGATPPDINEKTPDGKNVSLYSLRGQYVLLDFWAAWCRPCRGESPTLVSAYNKYNKDGFTIYSVSLDEDKADWEAAIKKDDLEAWTHVSDLKGWSCAPAKEYGVSSIPANFLLDKNGKIIAKDLRGEALEAELKKIFGH